MNGRYFTSVNMALPVILYIPHTYDMACFAWSTLATTPTLTRVAHNAMCNVSASTLDVSVSCFDIFSLLQLKHDFLLAIPFTYHPFQLTTLYMPFRQSETSTKTSTKTSPTLSSQPSLIPTGPLSVVVKHLARLCLTAEAPLV